MIEATIRVILDEVFQEESRISPLERFKVEPIPYYAQIKRNGSYGIDLAQSKIENAQQEKQIEGKEFNKILG